MKSPPLGDHDIRPLTRELLVTIKEMRMPEVGDETTDLVATVEERRTQDYADVDPTLVSDILTGQHQSA